mmetsp:Transcript_4219/g.7164  ORF Transcript_4219/g.7164 Transcript_4219/m.7164 type:complete len:127 (-) Transcript_4219:60-440(-)
MLVSKISSYSDFFNTEPLPFEMSRQHLGPLKQGGGQGETKGAAQNEFFTKRGGHVQRKKVNFDIEEIINMNKPRKAKMVKIVFSLLKHFFSSVYFVFIIVLLLFLKNSYDNLQRLGHSKIKYGKFL